MVGAGSSGKAGGSDFQLLDEILSDADARLQSVLEENIKLSKERDSLALTSKKFARDLAKLAQKELQKINMFTAPRDKLDNLLGADDFLPVLIYVTLKSTMDVFEETLVSEKSYDSQQWSANENEVLLNNSIISLDNIVKYYPNFDSYFLWMFLNSFL
ncbi:hypothetical protein J5N97_009511 [Dioscorea zingiberensis]|uniref:Uncharacterized protein n=1 Tax=Dioscorea zingiberensis TaxID=325984 RepID=A0A9D5HM07_9LILI|nr:hypothetical protein J5N97_009511 [Dioscorea zingiberensis]